VVRYAFGDPSERAIDRLQLELFVYQLAQSPHLPKLIDAGRLSDGSPFIVMDRVHGRTLAEKLSDGPVSIPAVLELGRELMSGLGAAHRHGIVHRDIKPQNLILEEAPDGAITLKIIDFGICSRERRVHSSSSVVLGTPSYMSPEQISGAVVDVRTDIYSACVVLYEAITGRLPFEGGSSIEIFTSVLHAPLLPPRVLRENCPVGLEKLLVHGLARDPDKRMIQAIDELVRQGGFPSGSNAFRAPASLLPSPPRGREAQTQRSFIPKSPG
jgi:serine/threonine protein kinase